MKVRVVAYHRSELLFEGWHNAPLMLDQPLWVGQNVYKVTQQVMFNNRQTIQTERINHGTQRQVAQNERRAYYQQTLRSA